ncbi:MAG: acyltransferase [Comamonadaceae bacterium]|nr:acyltransferase [Comamonadaceae bacterium]
MTDSALPTTQAPAPGANPDAARLPGLDAVRALAIAAVLAYHLNVPGLFNAGFLGVDVFFNLSGFLITSLLLREFFKHGQVDIGRYFWRRFVRLMPAVAALLLLTYALVPLLMPGAARRLLADLPWAAAYLANWWQICSAQSYFENFGNPPLLRHLWSLGVEMQFYLLWPWLLLGLLRLWGVRAVLLTSLLLALASSAWMGELFALHPDQPSRAYLGADSHSVGLFLGSAMACLWSPLHPVALITRALPWRLRLALGSTAVVMLVGLMWFGNEAQPLLYQGGFLLTALASVMLLACCADLGLGQRSAWLWRLAGAMVQWLGTRSYSIYLWHWPVFIYLKGDSTPDLEMVAQCLLWSALAAEISYRWVEGALTFTTRQWPPVKQRAAGYAMLGALLAGGLFVVDGFPCQSTTPPVNAASSVGAASTPGVTELADHQLDASALPTAEPVMAADSDLLAIGDSVMLGARHRMLRSLPGATVDAQVGRQMRQTVTLVQRYLEQKPDLKHAVVHLGTNGYILKSDLRRLLTLLQDAQQVVLINNFADRRWSDANNQILAQIAPEFSNVRLMDWHAAAQGNRHYFVQDGIHLSSDGITAFIRGIASHLGIIPLELPPNRPHLHPPVLARPNEATASASAPPSASASVPAPPFAPASQPASAPESPAIKHDTAEPAQEATPALTPSNDALPPLKETP